MRVRDIVDVGEYVVDVAVPVLHEFESNCSRDIVDQPKVNTGKESAGAVQFGA
jgi:hypothetical protein